jgi:hypothetical protein
MTENSTPKYSRRSVLTVGGAAAASAAFLAACGGKTPVTRLGSAPTTVKMMEEPVTDVVLLRTAMSVETMVSNLLNDKVVTSLVSGSIASVIGGFASAHKANLSGIASLISARGGAAYNGTNDKLMVAYGQPALDLIEAGKDKTDALALALALESLTAATYQYFVSLTNERAVRAAMMRIGATSARRAAVAAQLINSGTQAFTPSVDDKGVATVATLPGSFGGLSAQQVTLGPVNPESGTRAVILMDTPSLNSLIY